MAHRAMNCSRPCWSAASSFLKGLLRLRSSLGMAKLRKPRAVPASIADGTDEARNPRHLIHSAPMAPRATMAKMAITIIRRAFISQPTFPSSFRSAQEQIQPLHADAMGMIFKGQEASHKGLNPQSYPWEH